MFIDLSKAFDTVNYRILLSKLKYYGINGNLLAWIKSYLTDRKQYVLKQSTGLMDITCGVPQGSILGPLLFLIYVNDMFKASNIISSIMFADDTNLFFAHSKINVIFQTMSGLKPINFL